MDQWDQGPPEHTMDHRIGASHKRNIIYQVVSTWNREHPGNQQQPGNQESGDPNQRNSFKVSVVDSFGLTDARPETTRDGRHWALEMEEIKLLRPLLGEAEGICQMEIYG